MRAPAAVVLILAASCLLGAADAAENLAFRSPIARASHQLVARGLHRQFAIAKRDLSNATFTDAVAFRHSVASGDPYSDSVILWTRVTPDVADADVAVRVSYKVATDAALTVLVDEGDVETTADVDFTVKIEAAGLQPSTFYYYQFAVGAALSPVGRTKTIPEEDADVDSLRFAVVSCSNYPYGFFNSYGRIAEKSVDAVLHLGDYIYEYGPGIYEDPSTGRTIEPNYTIATLGDYRIRHAQYKTDADAQAAHEAHPFITVWDDHEVADNSWKDGATGYNATVEGPFSIRKANAIRAYYEWMPLRQVDVDNRQRIYRTFKFGKLLDLIMLDTRLWGRDQTDITDEAIINDPTRTILGFDQEKWFYDQLSASAERGAQWRLIGNQVVFAQMRSPISAHLDVDTWDGYAANRQRVMDHIANNSIDNVVFVTGDIHTNFGYDITPDPFDILKYNPIDGSGSLAVEFVAPAISSPSLVNDEAETAFIIGLLEMINPHLKYGDGSRGYLIVTIDKTRALCDYYALTVNTRNPDERHASALQTLSGTNRLSRP